MSLNIKNKYDALKCSQNVAKQSSTSSLTSLVKLHPSKSGATQLEARRKCAQTERKLPDTFRVTKASQHHTTESQ